MSDDFEMEVVESPSLEDDSIYEETGQPSPSGDSSSSFLVGALPDDWKAHRLDAICQVNPESFSEDNCEADEFEYISLSDATDGVVTNTESIPVKEAPSRATRKVREGDVLVGTVRPKQSSHGFATEEHDGKVCSSGFGVLRTDEHVNSQYLRQEVLSHRFFRQMMAYVAGSGYPAVKLSDLEKHRIALPPLPEQRKIASILYAVDQAIQKTEAIIEQAQRVKRGLVRDLMSHGLGEETKSVRLGPKEFSVPKSWKMVNLGELFDLVNGKVFDKNEWADEGVRIIRIQDLREDADSSINYCNHDVDEKYHVDSGDLLFCWAGNIKTSLGSYIWEGEKGYLNQHIYNMNPRVKVDLCFFKYAINRYLRVIKTMAGGSAGQVHVTKTDFERFELPVPDLRIQRLIAQRLNSAEEHVDRVKEELNQLARLKKGLMQDLLTGEVRTVDKAIEVLDEVKAHG